MLNTSTLNQPTKYTNKTHVEPSSKASAEQKFQKCQEMKVEKKKGKIQKRGKPKMHVRSIMLELQKQKSKMQKESEECGGEANIC